VPVTEETQPDPYIEFLPERDVVTPSGRTLTLINPALMVRKFNEMAQESYGAQGHISSLLPLNPDNLPDPWEADALRAFQQGTTEVTAVSDIDGYSYLRLIRPMVMGTKCLMCHQDQGYKVGDIAGGVSVSVPLTELEQTADERIMQVGMGHGALWFFGITGIYLGFRKLTQRIRESHRTYLALRENEERTSSIISTSLDAIITIDANDIITNWNAQAEVIFGWSSQEVLGKKLADHIIPQEFRERHLNGIRNYLASGEGPFLNQRLEVEALDRDGQQFPVELTIAPITIDGEPAFSAFVRNISERKQAEQQISRDYHSQRVIASVLEISMRSIPFNEQLEQSLDQILSTPWLLLQGTGAIFIVDKEPDNLIMAAQRGISEAIQQKCARVSYGDCLCGKAAQTQEIVFSSCVGDDHTISYDNMKPHGHYCIPIISKESLMGVLNLYLEHGHQKNTEEIQFLNTIANTLGNMIHRQRSDEKLQHYAYYDELTELPNRAMFLERMAQCIKHASQHDEHTYALLFMDLDRFKNINDSLGHMVGDQVLDCVAERLLQCVRPQDTVARLSGDEFGILLDGITDIAYAYQVATCIHDELLKPLQLDRYEVFTSASIGIAPGSLSYNHPTELLRDADTAMYRAKHQGSGHTSVFDEEMHARAVNLLTLETEMRRAVKQQEFEIHYQPIVSAHDNRIVGFESLLRWNHPQRGQVSPVEFIPIAEETGLINELGIWVLEESCRQNQIWAERYPQHASLYVSVNLSAVQFLKSDLITRIDNSLRSISYNMENLRLEITESILMENPESASQALQDLKSRGARLYLDDFGTGYSSLSYIHNFPFDALKIDRSFVSKLGTGDKHTGMVKTIIAVARNFNMEVIAEGVETRDQMMQLREMGCENLQGYYFSKPVAASEAEKLLSSSDELRTE
jgi:diguanylate cyclase (GGDEF)-like protein/PAS domain S-box-containing protein